MRGLNTHARIGGKKIPNDTQTIVVINSRCKTNEQQRYSRRAHSCLLCNGSHAAAHWRISFGTPQSSVAHSVAERDRIDEKQAIKKIKYKVKDVR